MKTHLYRHFSADGRLLYVGISISALERFRAHQRNSDWVDDVARIEIEHFSTRQLALVAERTAIQRERPLFNRQRYGAKYPLPDVAAAPRTTGRKMAVCVICGDQFSRRFDSRCVCSQRCRDVEYQRRHREAKLKAKFSVT